MGKEVPDRGQVVLDVQDVTGRRFIAPLVGAALLATLAVTALARWDRRPAPLEPAATLSVPASDDRARAGWTLAFSDEFDGATLDRAKWNDSYPGGVRTHSNNEQQYYATDGWQVRGGYLRFTAKRRAMGGMPYTSGMIASHGLFAQEFGRFEVRARVPKGKGLWPAFWLLPESRAWPPEIDVMEALGHKPREVLLTHHWPGPEGKSIWKTATFAGPDFTADFHTFAVEWGPREIVWYVDGVERHRATEQIPREPMYVLANLAVGGDLPGMPDETTPFPSVMEVDYVRVYRR